jgi:predicted ATPase
MKTRRYGPDSGRFIQAVTLRRHMVPEAAGYPFDIPAVRHLERLPFEAAVTYFVGENGSGKSTLLEGIAAAFGLNPEGGTKHLRFSTRRSHSKLSDALQLTRSRTPPTDSYFLRAETFYNLSTAIERPEDYNAYDLEAQGGRSLHDVSHGEAFLALVLNRLRGNGLYLFDEPEAALSPARQLALMAAMDNLVKRGSQFIVATHSPILLGYPGATIYLFGQHASKVVPYHETEHYQITKAFLDCPERMLRELLRDDPGGAGEEPRPGVRD